MRGSTKMLLQKLNSEYDKLSNQAVQLIASEAKQILKSHSSLYEFCMAMGSSFFIDHSGEPIDNDKYKYLQEFNDMVNELDEMFHITGTPMRFSANSEIRTNWGTWQIIAGHPSNCHCVKCKLLNERSN